jgi:hypothetical protein
MQINQTKINELKIKINKLIKMNRKRWMEGKESKEDEDRRIQLVFDITRSMNLQGADLRIGYVHGKT